MCVPAVVESDIAEVVVEDHGMTMDVKVIGHDGKVLGDGQYVFARVNDDSDHMIVSRLYNGGQAFHSFEMTIDYNADGYYAASPVTVTDIRGLTTSEIKALVTSVMGQTYEASAVELSPYKAVKSITLRDKVLVDDIVANQKKGLEEALPAPKLEYAELG